MRACGDCAMAVSNCWVMRGTLHAGRSGHRQKIETPKILKYVAREILNVRYTWLRPAILRHQRGNLSNRAVSVDKLNEGCLDCAQRHLPLRHDDVVAVHTAKRSYHRDVAKSFG